MIPSEIYLVDRLRQLPLSRYLNELILDPSRKWKNTKAPQKLSIETCIRTSPRIMLIKSCKTVHLSIAGWVISQGNFPLLAAYSRTSSLLIALRSIYSWISVSFCNPLDPLIPFPNSIPFRFTRRDALSVSLFNSFCGKFYCLDREQAIVLWR